MKFFIDENVSPKTVEFLRNLGLDVLYGTDSKLKGKSDAEVYDYCKLGRYVLITFDHEFGLEYINRKDLEGLIILRVHPQTIELLHPILKSFFLKVDAEELKIKGNISVIERGRVRVRKVV